MLRQPVRTGLRTDRPSSLGDFSSRLGQDHVRAPYLAGGAVMSKSSDLRVLGVAAILAATIFPILALLTGVLS